jgi:hypothetical protein
MDAAVDRGRAAFAREAWAEAWQALSDADAASPLEPEDLEQLSTAAYLPPATILGWWPSRDRARCAG